MCIVPLRRLSGEEGLENNKIYLVLVTFIRQSIEEQGMWKVRKDVGE